MYLRVQPCHLLCTWMCCSSKDLQILQTNIAHGKLLDQGELGIRDNIVVPDGASMAAIAETLKRMEQTTSAMVKLELLLEAVKLTYDNVSHSLDQGSDEHCMYTHCTPWSVVVLACQRRATCQFVILCLHTYVQY